MEDETKKTEEAVDPKIIEKFDPKVAELNAIVAETKNITADDLTDPEQLAIVKKNRIALGKARVKIEKAGLAARDEANKFNKAVLSYEKSLIAIIKPEEDRLDQIEEAAKALAIRNERLEKLPARKERIEALNLEVPADDILLEMDSVQFEAFYNECVAKKNENDRIEAQRIQDEKDEADRIKRQAEQDAIDAENARIKKAQDDREAEIKAEADRIKAEQDARDAELKKEADRIQAEKDEMKRKQDIKDAEDRARKEAEDKAKKEAEAKAEADRIAEEKRIADEKAEAEKLEKREAFLKFRSGLGYTEENKDEFKTEETETGYAIWRKLGEFPK